MKLHLTLFLGALVVVLVVCQKEAIEENKTKVFQRNPDYWVHHVEQFKPLRSNLFIQLTNQSSQINPIKFTVAIDDEFVLSSDTPNLRFGHHQEVFGTSVPEGKRTIRIVAGDGKAQAEKEIEVTGRLFVMVSFWSDPQKTDTHSIHIEESHRVFSLQ